MSPERYSWEDEDIVFINDTSKNDNTFEEYHPLDVIQNKFDEEAEGLIQTQQASLQNAIMGVESQAVSYVIENVFKVKNKFNEVGEILPEEEQNNLRKELAAILIGYYGIIVPLFGRNTLDRRAKEFGLFTNFKMNNNIKDYIKDIAEKASSSHIQTIANDLLDTINETYNKLIEDNLETIRSVRSVTDADLVLARKKALEGASQQEIVKAIRQEYNDKILKVRAKAIARTETNRAFTQSQFQADLQFIKQNGLQGKSYKKWITRSDNPCAICLDLAAQPPIPFETNFANIGDTLTGVFTNTKGITRVLKQVVSFEDLAAGNAHVNCACRYQLIIENDFSDNDFKADIDNRGYNPNRDPDGKFGVGSNIKTYSKDLGYYKNFTKIKTVDPGSSDFSRAVFTEEVVKKLGFNKKPTKVEKFSKGTTEIYRGWDDQAHIDSYLNDENPRLSWGISGNGVYFSNNIDDALGYSSHKVKSMAIKKSAKGVNSDELFEKAVKNQSDIEYDINTRVNKLKDLKPDGYQKQVKELYDIKKAAELVHSDLGTFAAVNGYDYIINTTGTPDGISHYVVLNRGVLEYVSN